MDLTSVYNFKRNQKAQEQRYTRERMNALVYPEFLKGTLLSISGNIGEGVS